MKKLVIFFISVCALGLSAKNVHASVLINEVHSFGTNDDWVELYATETTDISGWFLRDSSGDVIHTISSGTTLTKESPFYVANVTKRLNKEKDSITLFMANFTKVEPTFSYGMSDSVCYAQSATQSVGRYPDGTNTIERFSVATKGSTNSSQFDACPTKAPTMTTTPTVTPTLIPTLTETFTPTKAPTKSPTPTPVEEDTLGDTDELSPTRSEVSAPIPSLSDTNDEKSEDQSSFSIPIPAIFLGTAGLLFMTTGIVLFLKKRQEV